MKSNLIGRYIKKVGYRNIIYNEIVAVYMYKGELYLVACNIDNELYKCTAIGITVVERNSIPADGLK